MLKNRLFLKIIMIFTLPALGILFFSTKVVYDSIQYSRAKESLIDTILYVKNSNELLNNLQKERELSLIFINKKELSIQFNNQKKLTNESFGFYFNFLKDIEFDVPDARIYYNKLEDFRKKVEDLTTDDFEILDFYTTLNKNLIKAIYNLNKNNLDIAHLLNYKEGLSFENSLTLIALFKKELNVKLQNELLISYAIQKDEYEHFINSSKKYMNIYNKVLISNINKEIEEYRKALKNYILDEKSLDYWLMLSQKRIQNNNLVIEEVLEDLMFSANILKSDAKLNEHLSYIFLFLSFITLISLFFVLKNIILNEQKSYEKVKKQKKVYELLNQMNKYILKKNSKEELYFEINTLISENKSMVFSFIYDIEDENSKIYAIKGKLKNLLERELEEYKRKNSDNLLTKAIKQETNIIVENFSKRNISVFYKYADEYSIKSAIALPIKKFGKVVSVLVIYSNEDKFFHYEVEILFDKMISDMNHVLEKLDYEQIRLNQEKQLRISSVAFESSEPMIITDENEIIIEANQAFCEFSKYSKEYLLGRKPNIFKSLHQSKEFYENMWSDLRKNGKWSGEIYNLNGEDNIVPVVLTITVIKDEKSNVINYLGQYFDISDLKDKEQILQYQATHDNLTGLPNRLLLLDRIEHAITKVVRHKIVGGLIFIDLDNFKEVNDTLGHDIGDLLLVEVAKKLKELVREEDTVSRIGGDEFIVLADNIGKNKKEALENIEKLAIKIKKALNDIEYLDKYKNISTPSIGITLFNDSSVSVQTLIKQADKAMYQAKKQGKNSIEFFN